jgi:hypothetical protein
MSKRAIVIAIVLAAAAVGALAFFYEVNRSTLLCDGCYELEVVIQSPKFGEIEDITCEAFGEVDAATFSQYLRFPWQPFWGVKQKPSKDEPVKVYIPWTERVRPFGRSTANYPFRKLVVVAQFKGGRRAGKVVDIPKPFEARAVTVGFQ